VQIPDCAVNVEQARLCSTAPLERGNSAIYAEYIREMALP